MTQEETYLAMLDKTPINYHGNIWLIHDSYSDNTVKLLRTNRMGDIEQAFAPFDEIKTVKGAKEDVRVLSVL